MSEIKGNRWLAGVGVWIAAVAMLAACAGPWQPIRGNLTSPEWTIAAPQGWMHMSMPDSEMLSKNGPYLEYILVQSRPLAKRFRFTSQVLDPGMLPHEAAQLIIDNLRSDPRIRGFQLLASEPAVAADRDGFKLIYSYVDKYGVTMKTVYYGILLPDRFFNIRYSAAQRYYFEQELPTFESVLSSLQLPSGSNS
ncbi:hypothetical protein [Desulfosarcina widdelii]|nr:hypothetical protein [Desulfosarcina widdelii]